VTVYGVVHASVDYLDSDSDAIDGWDVASRATRLGFKGTEDLSNGLKAIWKMEFQVDIADAGQSVNYRDAIGTLNQRVNSLESLIASGASSSAIAGAEAQVEAQLAAIRGATAGLLGSPTAGQGNSSGAVVNQQNDLVSARNMYIGLAGGFGTFLVGRHDTPYKMSTGSLDLFADTLADYNSTLLMTDIRTGSAIAYVSPAWSGFTLSAAGVVPHTYQAAYTFGTGATAVGMEDADADGLEAYSIAAVYNANGFFASAAYESLSKEWLQSWTGVGGGPNTPFTEDDTKYRLGLGFTGGGFTVGAIWEDHSDVLGLDGRDKQSWQISAGYTFGNNMVKAMYGQVDWDKDYGDMDQDAWAVGLDHNLSKRTKVYALYTDVDRDELPHTSISTDVSGFSMGMVHSF
jgi:predicted porin